MLISVYRKKTLASFVLMLFTLLGCKSDKVFVPESPVFSNKLFASPLSKKITDRVNLVKTVVADTLTEIAPGVKQTILNYRDYSDKPMRLFILEVDLNNPRITIKAGTPNNSTQYARQVVSEIARLQDAAGSRVLAAVNGDFFNGTTGEPQSILYKNGIAVKPFSRLCALCTFLSIDDQGAPFIGNKDRKVDTAKIRQAVGGYHWLVKDSAKVSQGDASVEPRTAVGVKADKTVYFVVVDGRKPGYSNGMSLGQLSDVFFALGVKDAINMDGGGSTTMVVKNGTGWKVSNNPSDGAPRDVANAWTVVDTQQ